MAEMRFNFRDQTNLTAREAAKASGVEESFIVTGYAAAVRKGSTGFNAGGIWFGIVGAVPDAPVKPAKPMLNITAGDRLPELPGSTCTPKHPAPPRGASNDDIPDFEPEPEIPPPAPAAPAEPKERPMGRIAARYKSVDFKDQTFAASDLAEKFGMHSVTIRRRVETGEEISGHIFTPAVAADAPTAPVFKGKSSPPPRAPKTRRTTSAPEPIVTQLPVLAKPPIGSLQAQRERYQREHEEIVGRSTEQLRTRLAVLDDLDRMQAN